MRLIENGVQTERISSSTTTPDLGFSLCFNLDVPLEYWPHLLAHLFALYSRAEPDIHRREVIFNCKDIARGDFQLSLPLSFYPHSLYLQMEIEVIDKL